MNKKLIIGLVAGFSTLVLAGGVHAFNQPKQTPSHVSDANASDPTPSPQDTIAPASVEPTPTPRATPIQTPAPTTVATATPNPFAGMKLAPVADVPVKPGVTVLESHHIYAYENGQHQFKLIRITYSDYTDKYTLPDGTPFNYFVVVESADSW